MIKCALATSNQYSELTKDDRLVYKKLIYYGIDVEPIVWDSKDTAWNHFHAVFIRSCWDYHLKYDQFFSWLERLERENVTVLNSPELLKWNSNKSYMLDLQEKGIDIVPTILVEQTQTKSLEELLQDNDWKEAVVKPAISSNALETWLTNPQTRQDDQKRFEEMLSKHNQILIQKFVQEIKTKGEWSFVFFDKEFSHSVLKKPKESDFRVQEDFGGVTFGKRPPSFLLKEAEKVIEKIEGECLYARVDGIEVDKNLTLMELELIEPSLYLDRHPKAPIRFAECILTKLNDMTLVS